MRSVRIPIPAAAFLITITVVAATWPFAIQLSSGVTDLGDPLLNSWALAWVAHAFLHSPLGIFDGNIFHPSFAWADHTRTEVFRVAMQPRPRGQ